MRMRQSRAMAGGERRLLYKRGSGFWEHMRAYGNNFMETYYHNNNAKGVLDYMQGAVGAAANILLKAGEQIYKGAVGQKFNEPNGILGHTRADLRSLLSNIVHIRPLRALGDAWSLATSDLPMDVINGLTGNNLNEHQRKTRNAISHTLAA
jgi:hypothetical protein